MHFNVYIRQKREENKYINTWTILSLYKIFCLFAGILSLSVINLCTSNMDIEELYGIWVASPFNTVMFNISFPKPFSAGGVYIASYSRNISSKIASNHWIVGEFGATEEEQPGCGHFFSALQKFTTHYEKKNKDKINHNEQVYFLVCIFLNMFWKKKNNIFYHLLEYFVAIVNIYVHIKRGIDK